MNKEKIDHYSIFKTLTEKYGEPQSVTPQKSVWKNDEITMTLEKPLTLKFLIQNILYIQSFYYYLGINNDTAQQSNHPSYLQYSQPLSD